MTNKKPKNAVSKPELQGGFLELHINTKNKGYVVNLGTLFIAVGIMALLLWLWISWINWITVTSWEASQFRECAYMGLCGSMCP